MWKTRNPVLLALALGFGVLFPAGFSSAGVDNTHHDLRRYLPGSRDSCGICHARKDMNDYGVLDNDLGRTGGVCLFLCHSGKGILPETATLVPEPGPVVDTMDFSTASREDYTAVYFSRSHGRNPGNLKNAEGRPVAWPPPGITWQGVAAGSKLECTSCHAIHDGTYPPFLHGPLGANYPDRDGMCDRCHLERATNNLATPPDGNHPVDFPVDPVAAAGRSGNRRGPRRILIQKYGAGDNAGKVPVFDVPNPAPSVLNDPGASWSMGGHLTSGPDRGMETWRGAGTIQQMGCYTCHSAHSQDSPGTRTLVVVKPYDGESGWNPVCTGCHGSSTTAEGDRNEWNVGMTPFGHPAGAKSGHSSTDNTGVYTTTVAGFRFRIAGVKYVLPQDGNRFGKSGQLLCTTCHKVHHGKEGTKAIANLGQGTRSVCKACHSGVGLPNENDWSKGGTVTTGQNALNSHHVTATKVIVGGVHLPEREETIPLYISRPTWADPISGLGDIEYGMDCADCHVFNGTAHNW